MSALRNNDSTGEPTKTTEPFAVPDPTTLSPPQLDRLFTAAELRDYDGSVPDRNIYVGIKGLVYDVTAKREMYGAGGSYHVFAGRDASRALGKSSLREEDVSADYSVLTTEELKVLDDWEIFFRKRYSIVGRIVE